MTALTSTTPVLALVAMTCLAALPSPALAQQQTVATEVAEAAPDAAIDRGVMAKHAETTGEGRWTISSYEIAGLGLSYGISEDAQVSFTTVLPLFESTPFVGILTGKQVFHRSPQVTAAGSGHLVIVGSGGSYVGAVGGGVHADFYLDQGRRFAIHTGLELSAIFGGDVDTSAFALGDGAITKVDLGTTLALTDWMKLVVEAQVPIVTISDVALVPVVPLSYGVRFYSDHFSADVGLMKPLALETSDDIFAAGYPYIALNGRF